MAKKKLLPSKKTKTLPVVSDNILSAYLNFVNTLPVLSLEQEQEIARRYKYKKDRDAAQQLVLSHFRF
ncbi:RNA polymerase sigma factor RpoH, partial [Francisella tularensis subsp. holarctica]|nr:RNA polymerase sigma factor RpoH [Francisella tularensis subsp. holarctica]